MSYPGAYAAHAKALGIFIAFFYMLYFSTMALLKRVRPQFYVKDVDNEKE
jgi:hypothetical protein